MRTHAAFIPNFRLQKFLPATAFFAGLLWDTYTIKRIDTFFDNFIVLGYLTLLGALIIITNFIEKGLLKNALYFKYQKYYPLVIQFLFGGLFSVYTVLYFHSSSLSNSALFFSIIAVLLVANEFLQKKYTNLYLQISLYYLVNFTFFIFFLPVILKTMSFWTFFAAGFISIVIVESMVYLFQRSGIFQHYREQVISKNIPFFLFILLTVFYLNNWIPPVPLSLKDSGVYHQVEKKSLNNGQLLYELTFEKPSWYEFLKKSDDVIHYEEGTKAYAFASVFAPTNLKTTIYHVWQKYDESQKSWLTSDEIHVDITGGRAGGYRGMSFKEKITTGEWRVNVVTESRQLLGRINFEIREKSEREIVFKTITK